MDFDDGTRLSERLCLRSARCSWVTNGLKAEGAVVLCRVTGKQWRHNPSVQRSTFTNVVWSWISRHSRQIQTRLCSRASGGRHQDTLVIPHNGDNTAMSGERWKGHANLTLILILILILIPVQRSTQNKNIIPKTKVPTSIETPVVHIHLDTQQNKTVCVQYEIIISCYPPSSPSPSLSPLPHPFPVGCH